MGESKLGVGKSKLGVGGVGNVLKRSILGRCGNCALQPLGSELFRLFDKKGSYLMPISEVGKC